MAGDREGKVSRVLPSSAERKLCFHAFLLTVINPNEVCLLFRKHCVAITEILDIGFACYQQDSKPVNADIAQ